MQCNKKVKHILPARSLSAITPTSPWSHVWTSCAYTNTFHFWILQKSYWHVTQLYYCSSQGIKIKRNNWMTDFSFVFGNISASSHCGWTPWRKHRSQAMMSRKMTCQWSDVHIYFSSIATSKFQYLCNTKCLKILSIYSYGNKRVNTGRFVAHFSGIPKSSQRRGVR